MGVWGGNWLEETYIQTRQSVEEVIQEREVQPRLGWVALLWKEQVSSLGFSWRDR